MVNWREQKAKMLRGVHSTFQVDAVYLTHSEGQPVRVRVRIHRKTAVDQLNFADFGDAASTYQAEDIVVFDMSEVAKPLPDAFLVVSRSEGYRLGASKPKQDGYVYVSVVEMRANEIDDLLIRSNASGPDWAGVL